MKKLTLLLLLTPIFALADIYIEIRETIKLLESECNIKAVGDNGKAYGVLQIHKIAVDEVNRIYGTTYTHQDAFDEQCSNEIFDLIIQLGVEIYIKKYSEIPNEKRIVQMWNFGIYQKPYDNGYYKRYLKFKDGQNLELRG